MYISYVSIARPFSTKPGFLITPCCVKTTEANSLVPELNWKPAGDEVIEEMAIESVTRITEWNFTCSIGTSLDQKVSPFCGGVEAVEHINQSGSVSLSKSNVGKCNLSNSGAVAALTLTGGIDWELFTINMHEGELKVGRDTSKGYLKIPYLREEL